MRATTHFAPSTCGRVITLRCTARLQRLLGLAADPIDTPSTSRLGDWYGTFLTTRPRHLAICVNERSLLTIILPLAPRPGFLLRFQATAAARIAHIPAPQSTLHAETMALASPRVGATRNRSVLGSLNNLRYLALTHLAREPHIGIEALSSALCDTPMLSMACVFPWEQATILLGGDVDAARHKILDAT